jgi:hypothetical protein
MQKLTVNTKNLKVAILPARNHYQIFIGFYGKFYTVPVLKFSSLCKRVYYSLMNSEYDREVWYFFRFETDKLTHGYIFELCERGGEYQYSKTVKVFGLTLVNVSKNYL